MRGLTSIFSDGKILFIISSGINLLLLIQGLFLKRKFAKEKNLIKKINKKFLLKYKILFMLIMGMLFIAISSILTFICENIGNFLMFASLVFIFVSIEWAFIFESIDIYSNFSKEEIVEQYILSFIESESSDIKYSEIIVWFSWWNHQYFRVKNYNEQDVDKIITRLELLLRPYNNRLCLASYHKNEFLNLCKKWGKCTTEEKLKEIELTAEKMENEPLQKYRFFELRFDRNILIYLSIIALHVAASILLCDGDFKNAFGNILFYIPSDILLILAYKGIINEKEENRK